ncbi:MAG: hypothetical protein H8E46_03450 [FCB group bacterium]|nr:hypothetical protein [FCB group bacterium]
MESTPLWVIIATFFATASIAVIAIVQSILLLRDRSANTTISIVNRMTEKREKWNDLFELPDYSQGWNDDQKSLADFIGASLQQAAYLAYSGFSSKKYFYENYAAIFFRSWLILKDFIKDQRKFDGQPVEMTNGAFSRIHFEKIALKCGKHLKRKHSKFYEYIMDMNGRGQRFSNQTSEN